MLAKKRQTPCDALRAAKRSMLRESDRGVPVTGRSQAPPRRSTSSDPYFWAAFVHYGAMH